MNVLWWYRRRIVKRLKHEQKLKQIRVGNVQNARAAVGGIKRMTAETQRR